MSTKQSPYFKGLARTPMPSPHKVGDGHEVLSTHVFTEDVLTTDVLELIPLPPGCRVTGLDFVTENIGAINLTMISSVTCQTSVPTTAESLAFINMLFSSINAAMAVLKRKFAMSSVTLIVVWCSLRSSVRNSSVVGVAIIWCESGSSITTVQARCKKR